MMPNTKAHPALDAVHSQHYCSLYCLLWLLFFNLMAGLDHWQQCKRPDEMGVVLFWVLSLRIKICFYYLLLDLCDKIVAFMDSLAPKVAVSL